MLLKPRKKIDPIEVRDLAAVGCTIEEIALQVKCNPATIYRRFARVIKEGRLRAYMSLRRKMFELAMNGNLGACIWLSKQWLGQSDRHEVSGPDQANASRVATTPCRCLSFTRSTESRREHVMRPLRYSINVTLDGCCDHRVMIPDENLHRHAVENLDQADASSLAG